ncbi:MAG: PQQ-binding-like beta-propeller repeat protein, partial [Thermoguttaceae bacterium]|nr:PQQ-binding-like beta-propeller repeat protein [Thermoguttaceae bacterium]
KDGVDVALAASQAYLQTLDLKTGEAIQNVKVGWNLQTASVPLVFDDLILVGSADAGLCAFDAATFERRWNVPTRYSLVFASPYTKVGSKTVEASPVRVGDYVVYGGLDGVLYVVDPRAEGQKIVQTIDFGAPILASIGVAADGGTIFVGDYSGRVTALDVAK